MNRCGRYLVFLLLALLLTVSCTVDKKGEKRRSMYYWSTTFSLDSTKRQFLRQHDIRRIYLRYFDVVVDDNGAVKPNATCHFVDSVPEGVEIVPVVFIVNNVMSTDTAHLAELIFKRIMQISETHDLGDIREIQIDCDWTRTTRSAYFGFLHSLAALCHDESADDALKRSHPVTLSTTIRLHQLAGPVPDVDRGVLMVYNTGDISRLEVEKPILDPVDVHPYMQYLSRFDLPMSTALPLFSMRLLFRQGTLVDVIHADEDLPRLSTDSVVVRSPSLSDILATKKMLAENGDIMDEIILYDMNNDNLTKFNTNDYETIFK